MNKILNNKNIHMSINLRVVLKFLIIFIIINAHANALKIASGNKLGKYYTIANKICFKNGFTSGCVIETSGSTENIELLQNGLVDYAIVQDGFQDNFRSQVIDKEEFFIFYKGDKVNNLQDLILKAGEKYIIDEKSGSFKTFKELANIFNFDIKGKSIRLKDVKDIFCSDEDLIYIYHISRNSLVFLNAQACNVHYYVFNHYEANILKNNGFFINNYGLIESKTYLIQK